MKFFPQSFRASWLTQRAQWLAVPETEAGAARHEICELEKTIYMDSGPSKGCQLDGAKDANKNQPLRVALEAVI